MKAKFSLLLLTLLLAFACGKGGGSSILPATSVATPAQVAACSTFDGGWRCPKIAKPVLFGVSTSPIIPTSWTVVAWFVDPSNLSGTASDANDCITSTTPCLTWHEINDHRWGCIGSPAACPRLQQNTTITFWSSHTTNADPVYLLPAIEKGAVVIIKGNLGASQQTQTGSLASIVAKNRATGQLLNATIGGGGIAGQLIVNSTVAGRAFLYKSLGANAWSLTQPLAPITLPTATNNPAEVVWANTNTFTVYNPVAVNLVRFTPTFTDYNGGFSNVGYIYQLTIFDPAGAGSDNVYIGDHVSMFESTTQREITTTFTASDFAEAVVNVYNIGGLLTGKTTGGFYDVFAGAVPTGLVITPTGQSQIALDGDIILGSSLVSSGLFGFVFVDTGVTINIQGNARFVTIGGGYAGHQLWGSGTALNVQGSSRLSYTGTATAEFTLTGALQLNGGTTGHSVNTSANVDVICGGITVNVANLDAASGATCATSKFGGLAFNPGGASITSGAQ